MVDFSPYYMARVPGLKKRGEEYRAACPVHGGERESFSVDLATGRWRCFSGCDEGGDAYRLEQRLSGRPFPECKRVVDEIVGLEVAVPMAVGRDGVVAPRPSRPSSSSAPATFGRLVATYDYHDALGELVYQVCRYEPKAFSQRRPDPANPGRWIKGLGGADRLLYRLPDVLSTPGPVYVPEGEKDVELARSWGLNATCNSGGAGKFTPAMARALKGRTVVVLVDNDAPNPKTGKIDGEKHAEAVATLLMLEGCSVRLVRFGRDGIGPKDLTDWAALGNDRAKLEGLVDAAPNWGAPLEVEREVGPVPDGLPANLHEMCANYVVLVGSEMIWDHRRGRTTSPKELKIAHAADYNAWIKDAACQRVDIERLVFAPHGERKGEINTFRGLTMKPNASRSCARLVEHLAFLCGGDPALTHWLTCWLAYPLQNLGAKMKTSVVVHGGQGTGKSMLFEAVARVYGEYATVIGQTQIDSAYNGWASRKLFVLADEVLSTREARTIKNRLKSLITGETIIVEEKYRQARTEQNCMNLVFLSNEETPVIVERDDRRFTVIRVEAQQEAAYYDRLAAEIENGGVESFMAYLMGYALGEFTSHTKPYMTNAKDELVEVSLSPTDRFLDLWQAGELPVPFGPASSPDLFEAYKLWAIESGERFGVATMTAFGRIAGRRFEREQRRLGDGRRSLVYTPREGSVEAFSHSLGVWRERLQRARI